MIVSLSRVSSLLSIWNRSWFVVGKKGFDPPMLFVSICKQSVQLLTENYHFEKIYSFGQYTGFFQRKSCFNLQRIQKGSCSAGTKERQVLAAFWCLRHRTYFQP